MWKEMGKIWKVDRVGGRKGEKQKIRLGKAKMEGNEARVAKIRSFVYFYVLCIWQKGRYEKWR